MVRLVSCQVVFHRANVQLRTRTAVRDDLMAFLVTAPTARGTVNGLALAPDLHAIALRGSRTI